MHDKAIVKDFIRYGFDEVDLVRLNKARKHLKVLYISGITEGNGKPIKTSIFNEIQEQIWMETRETSRIGL